jgi:hypothetical protein
MPKVSNRKIIVKEKALSRVSDDLLEKLMPLEYRRKGSKEIESKEELLINIGKTYTRQGLIVILSQLRKSIEYRPQIINLLLSYLEHPQFKELRQLIIKEILLHLSNKVRITLMNYIIDKILSIISESDDRHYLNIKLLDLARSTNNISLKRILIRLFGFSRDEFILRNVIEFITDDEVKFTALNATIRINPDIGILYLYNLGHLSIKQKGDICISLKLYFDEVLNSKNKITAETIKNFIKGIEILFDMASTYRQHKTLIIDILAMLQDKIYYTDNLPDELKELSDKIKDKLRLFYKH